MSDKQTFFLINSQVKQSAMLAIKMASEDMICEIKKKTRSLEQNAKMWAMLFEVSDQVNWYGNKLTSDEWKDVFSASLKSQKVVPGIDGGFVVCGQRTSKMTKSEMAELIELMMAFGAERGVKFSDIAYD
jgi:hypothetical protein